MQRTPLALLIVGLVIPVFLQLFTAEDQSARRGYIGPVQSETIGKTVRAGFGQFEEQKYAEASESFQHAFALNPKDDFVLYLAAASHARAGNRKEALARLEDLAKLNTCFEPSPRTFAVLQDTPEFQAVAKKLERNRPHPRHAQVAFTVAEKDLIPEGMAYDSSDGVFYLSSLYKRKIVRIRPGKEGESPIVEDFTRDGQDGLWAVLGLKVDSERRILWALSAAEPEMKGFTPETAGSSGVFQYDTRTGKLLKKYVLGPKPPHLFNDLTVNRNGDVFLTDSASGEIYTIRRSKDELEVMLAAGSFVAPNGITLSDDEEKLFVADVDGVYVMDVRGGQPKRLAQVEGISPEGLDGLYFYRNSLIGIVNALNGGRVARFDLNGKHSGIDRTEILDCNNPVFDLPTTGAIAGDSFYFIGNSQFGSYNPDGSLLPPEKLHSVLILRQKLAP